MSCFSRHFTTWHKRGCVFLICRHCPGVTCPSFSVSYLVVNILKTRFYWYLLCSYVVKYKLRRCLKTATYRVEGVGWGVNPRSKFLNFAKADPNSQFRGKYIRNNLIIRVSLICKLSGTPKYGASARRSLVPLPSVLNWIYWTPPPPPPKKKFLGTPLFETKSVSDNVGFLNTRSTEADIFHLSGWNLKDDSWKLSFLSLS
jgi:hypothetical protein